MATDVIGEGRARDREKAGRPVGTDVEPGLQPDPPRRRIDAPRRLVQDRRQGRGQPYAPKPGRELGGRDAVQQQDVRADPSRGRQDGAAGTHRLGEGPLRERHERDRGPELGARTAIRRWYR